MDNSPLRQRKDTLTSKWDILFEDTDKEWIGFKPALGDHVYPCYACRHMFSCLSSFQDHINRRVIVFKYNCAGCSNEILVFYNRCSFLLHTRKHFSATEGTINLCEVDVFTLPVSLAGFLPHPNIPFLYRDSEEPEVPENIYINIQFYSPESTDKGKQIITLKPINIVFQQPQRTLALRQVCSNIPKCEFITLERQEFLRLQSLAVDENSNTNVATTDNVDQGEVTQIKQEAIAEEGSPSAITIPVISKVESLKEKFKLPRCLECRTIQKGTMAEHYQGKNNPCDSSLSCSICKFIAPTPCSLRAHERIHENAPPFVCPDCGKDFEDSNLLVKHMDEVCFHLAKHIRYRCPGKRCGKLFALPTTFAMHFQIHLRIFFNCSACSAILFKGEDADAHKLLHDYCYMSKTYECPFCPEVDDLTEYNFKDHINIHATDMKRSVYVYMCKHCRNYFRSTVTYATHLLKCSAKVQVKKYDVATYITKQCEKCSNKIIFNERRPATLCNKCKIFSNLKPVVNKRYFCILCNKQIQPEEKTYHRKLCKYGSPTIVLPKLNVDNLENLSFSSSSSDVDSSSPRKLDKSKRRRSSDSSRTDDSTKKKRKRYNPNLSKQKKEVEPDLTADEPMQFDGTYRCQLCTFTSTDRAEFHNHVKEHRDISTAYQCMECAECFVVKPSLVKHLMHFHNIIDHESYLKDNDCFDIDAVKELESNMRLAPGESKEPVKENQCRVCRKEFDDALSLNKHFRIHGMAFLLRNSK